MVFLAPVSPAPSQPARTSMNAADTAMAPRITLSLTIIERRVSPIHASDARSGGRAGGAGGEPRLLGRRAGHDLGGAGGAKDNGPVGAVRAARGPHGRILILADIGGAFDALAGALRSEEPKSELQSLMRISYAAFSLT